MCGRFYLDDETLATEFWKKRILEVRPNFTLSEMAVKEIFPTQHCLVLTGQQRWHPTLMKWGYPKWHGSGSIINARSETVRTSKLFQKDIISNRIAVVSSGYFEWDQNKQRHYFTGSDAIQYMAGIYHCFEGETSFVILTKEATADRFAIHDRMPLLLTKEMLPLWQSDDYDQLL